jgi:uncharacterized protein
VKSLLIIFYRNPELSKVKTRLAAAVGDDYALAIYFKLVSHTRSVVTPLLVDKILYYSDFVDREDNWDNEQFDKRLQIGTNLGERMYNAFKNGFRDGYEMICVIGTDCLELTSKHIDDAFYQLKTHDVVIGPALDGGYYLLGMKELHSQFFHDKEWGTGTVKSDTLEDCMRLSLKVAELASLRDVDTLDDLPPELLPENLL